MKYNVDKNYLPLTIILLTCWYVVLYGWIVNVPYRVKYYTSRFDSEGDICRIEGSGMLLYIFSDGNRNARCVVMDSSTGQHYVKYIEECIAVLDKNE